MNYRDKKVLILGLGTNQGGLGAAKFFAKAGSDVLVTDLKGEEELKPSLDQLIGFNNITYHLGGHDYADIDWAEIIIRNQALKPNNEYRIYAEKSGKRVETDIGIFLEFVKKEQLIGVTGTKGKSTTSTLIYEAIKASGKNVLFAGNIGKSVLDIVEHLTHNTLLVLEISSFQLEAFDEHKISPHIAVITNIYPDHLNYYLSMDDYIGAKRIIAKYQTEEDYLILKKDDPITNSKQFLEGLESHIEYIDSNDLPSDYKPALLGKHNRFNIAAALKVAQILKIDSDVALDACKSFTGVNFRQQLIKEWEGIKIYNDTAATGPDATIVALNTFPNSILIAGGVNKNLTYDSLAQEIDKHTKSVYFLEGDVTEELKKQLSAISRQSSDKIKGTYNNLEELLGDVKKEAKPGDVILFSPGATSFNLFQNEFDRGRKFNEAVEKLFI